MLVVHTDIVRIAGIMRRRSRFIRRYNKRKINLIRIPYEPRLVFQSFFQYKKAPNQEYFEHLISIIKNTLNDKLSYMESYDFMIFGVQRLGICDVVQMYNTLKASPCNMCEVKEYNI